MSIVKTMNWSDFLQDMGDDFTYEAKRALFNYYEELSDSMGEPIEFDRVAIRCDWYEYDGLVAAFSEYQDFKGEDEEDMLAYFEDHTTMLELDNGHVLVEAF